MPRPLVSVVTPKRVIIIRRIVPIAFLAAGTLLCATEPSAEEKAFHEQVAPLLVKNCLECHNANVHKGGLSLETRGDAVKGGEDGTALVPGKAEDSPLYTLLVPEHAGAKPEMPKKKDPLGQEEVAKVKQWIDAGAHWPSDFVLKEKARGDKSFWSFTKLTDPAVPEAADAPPEWRREPIDRFIWAGLAAKGLHPNPPADPRSLIRRITYDLTGLPPTPKEVEAYVQAAGHDRQSATEMLVDRLLASPQYGERWGRHWLDVARFGESKGFERNSIVGNLWPYRDYVIDSFNQDKPFNRFIEEQIAGDVIGKDDPKVEVGTAFLVAGPYDDVLNQDPVAKATIKANTADEIITATGSAFLGITINCARCHDHKFDPIPTEDYYRLKAAFDGVEHGDRRLSTPEERRRAHEAIEPLKAEWTALNDQRTALQDAIGKRVAAMSDVPTSRPVLSAHLTEETFAPVPAKLIRFTMLSSSQNPASALDARIDEFEVWTGGAEPRNVALASAGAKATGANERIAKDFASAYDVSLVNDGKFSAAWNVGLPAVLTITLPQVETIEKVTFSYDRVQQSNVPISGHGPMVTEYEIHVSEDGKTWKKVADSFDRAPFNKALAEERRRRATTTPEEAKTLADLNRQITAVERKIDAVPQAALVYAGEFKQPTAHTTVLRGGDPMKPAGEIKPASLNLLDKVTSPYELSLDAPESERRLDLARWIASDENPLTARVAANRIWQYHFGTGIVDSPSDFGYLGGRPSNQPLLDWLARRLQQGGWKWKALHREIILSQTYQQASTWRKEGEAADKDARLLWRFPPARLDAEELRDTMLKVAGKLDPTMGGPGYRLYEYKQDNVSTYVPLDKVGPETYRRAIYHQGARAAVVDLLSDFDQPDNSISAPKRVNTITPLQALTMLNHSFVLDLAHDLATRVEREAGPDREKQILQAYQFAFQRDPTAQELVEAARFIEARGLFPFCRALLNADELIYLD